MAPLSLAVRAALLLAFFALGCKKDPDPRHFQLADFDSGKQLADTLRGLLPPGTRLNHVWGTMQGNGFRCGERAANRWDQKTLKVVPGRPYLQCWRSARSDFGLRKRDWTVEFAYDSSGVRDVTAGYNGRP